MSPKFWDRVIDAVIVYVQRHWPRPRAAVVSALLAVATGGITGFEASGFLGLSSQGRWLVSLAVTIAALGATLLVWYRAWRAYVVPKGRVGIIVALASDSDEEERRLRSEFIASLRDLFRQGTQRHQFSIHLAPRRLAEELCDDPRGRALAYLKERKGHVLILARVRAVDLGSGRTGRHLSLDGQVVHAPVAPDVSQDLALDMSAALPRRLMILPEGSLFQFEAASEWLDVATRYVVGLAAMLSGDLEYAETLLLEVERRLPTVRTTSEARAGLKRIERRVPDQIVALYAHWLGGLSREYLRTRDPQHLALADSINDRLLARRPNHYAALVNKALCAFAIHRDVRMARRLIARCKTTRDAAWRYSAAFLYAYEGKLSQACEEYHRAFKAKTEDLTLPVQCEEFIHLILESEPERGQLHFCTGMINLLAKHDPVGAIRDFGAFLAFAGEQFPAERALAERWIAEAGEIERVAA